MLRQPVYHNSSKSQYYIGYEARLPMNYGDGLGAESGVEPLGLLWEKLHGEKETEEIFLDFSEEIGVTLPGSEDYYRYFAGAKVAKQIRDEKYCNWEMVPGEYIVCNFEAENFDNLVTDALYKAQQYLFSTWLPRHQIETEMFCVEMYETHTPETTQMELWVKVK